MVKRYVAEPGSAAARRLLHRRAVLSSVLTPVELLSALRRRRSRGELTRERFSPVLPYAFTEYGAVMLASVLNSPVAIAASVQVVRAFVKLRDMLATHKDFARKLDALERKYDAQFKVVFDAIRQLMAPPVKRRGAMTLDLFKLWQPSEFDDRLCLLARTTRGRGLR